MMKPKTLLAMAAMMAATNSYATELNLDLYGKVDVSYDWQQDGDDDSRDNASRIGVKGKYELNNNLDVVFQIEQGVDVAHGGTEFDELFSMRNTYLGLKGEYGMIFFGTHDTPFKKAQGKIDVFNDHAGDIKNFVAGEVRARDAWGYHSPKMGKWQVQAMYVPSDGDFDSSQSASASYSGDRWILGFGLDEDMRKNDKSVASTKVYDSMRASAQYKLDNWKFGFLVQDSERQDISADSEQGYALSVAYSWNKWSFIAQHGESDIVADDVTSSNLGVQYKLLKNAKAYLHYWDFEKGSDDETVSLGFEYKL